MKKLIFMMAAFLTVSIASAQTDTTSLQKRSKSERTAAKKANAEMQSTTTTADKKKRKAAADSKSNTTTTKERAQGTTGVIDFPDTTGAGTGTGNDAAVPATRIDSEKATPTK